MIHHSFRTDHFSLLSPVIDIGKTLLKYFLQDFSVLQASDEEKFKLYLFLE